MPAIAVYHYSYGNKRESLIFATLVSKENKNKNIVLKSDFVGVADAQVLVPSADGRSRAHVFTLQKRYKCRRNKDSFDAHLEQGKRAVNYTQNWWATEKKKINFHHLFITQRRKWRLRDAYPPCPGGTNYKSFNDIIVVILRTLRKRLPLSVRNCTTNRGQMNSFIQRHLFLKYKQQMTRQEKIRQQESISGLFFRDCGYQMHEKRERGRKKQKQIIIAFELQSSQWTLERENNNIFKDNKTIDFVFGNTTFPRRNRGQHSFFFSQKNVSKFTKQSIISNFFPLSFVYFLASYEIKTMRSPSQCISREWYTPVGDCVITPFVMHTHTHSRQKYFK